MVKTLPAILLVVISFVFTFTYWPEMLNFPYFMDHGLLPYRDFSIVFTPLLPIIILITSRLIGFGPLTVHIIGTFILALTDFILTLAVYNSTKNLSRSLAAGLFFLYLSLAFESNHLWPDSLLAPILFGVYYSRRLIVKSTLFLLAILTKQTSLYILPLFLYFPLITLLPVLASASLLLIPGFYFWAVKYIFFDPGTQQVLLPSTRELIFSIFPLLTSGAILLKSRASFTRYSFFWIFFLTFFIYPRFGYFHLEPLIVIWIFFLAVTIKPISRFILTLSLCCLFYLPLLRQTVQTQRTYLEPDIQAIATDIRVNYKNSSLAIINAPEQIYFLSNHPPVVLPWVEQLSWLIKFDEAEFTTNFIARSPDLVLYQPFPRPSPIPIIEDYIKGHYALLKHIGSYMLMAKKPLAPTSE